MSSVVKAIVGVVSVVASVATFGWAGTLILAFASEDFKDFMLDQIGNIMALFGIEGEDVINTQVVDQRLYQDDDSYDSLFTEVALIHQQTQQGIIDIINIKTAEARTSYNNYFDYGKNTLDAGLPDTNVSAAVVPFSLVEPIIETEQGFGIDIISGRVGVPTKEEWTAYELNRLYGYESWNQSFVYTGKLYEVKFIDYNYGTDQYDVTIFRNGTQITETTITITPYDATQDNKHTYVKVSLVLAEETIVISETNSDVLIPKDSEVNSYSSTSIAVEYGTTVISIAAAEATRHYVVKYYKTGTDSSMWFYWCYKIGSGNTALDNANVYVTNLEMMPIVELRNSGVNTNADKESIKYKESRDILGIIGVDIDAMTDSINENPDISNIQDAYIYFGLDLTDSNPITAKMLYQLFDFVYFDADINTGGTTDSYTATFREGNFNSSLSWKSQTRTVVNGSIGTVGTYTNTILNGTDAVVRKQETEDQYVEYIMGQIATTTFVKRGGMYGVVSKSPSTGDLVVPLSKFFIDQLTPIEQMQLYKRSLRLAVYSAEITHLEWYETAAFMNLVKIVLTVAAIVIFVISLGSATSVSAFLLKAAVMLAAGLAFKLLLESVDNPYLKALIIAVAAYVLYSTGMMSDPSALGFWTADQVSTAVTQYTEFKMEILKDAQSEFSNKYEEIMDKFNSMKEQLAGYIDTDFVARLTGANDTKGFIEGPDLQVYRAVSMQYDWDLVKGRLMYDNAFEYDKYYILGIV